MAELLAKSRPIRRPSRLGAVWLSYRTRWLLWLSLLGVSGLIVMANFGSQRQTPLPGGSVVLAAFPRPPEPAPRANLFLSEGRPHSGPIPVWSKLRSLTLLTYARGCEQLWTAGAMPQLESLTLYSSIDDELIGELCRLYDLRSLSLVQSSGLTETAIEYLSAEPRLEYLSLGGIHHVSAMRVPGEDDQARAVRESKSLHLAASLKWPSTLKVLNFDDVSGTPLVRLNEWRSLPLLHTVGTRLYPREGTRLPEETLRAVRELSQLKRLYLTDAGKHAPHFVEDAQADLPTLRIRPMHYDPKPGEFISPFLIACLALTVIFVMHFSAQCIIPASQLIPGFFRWHAGFVGGIVAAIVIGSCFCIVRLGCPISVALALSGTPVLLLAVTAKLLRSIAGFPMPGFTNFGLAMPCLVLPVLILQFGVSFFGSEFDWFLRGQLPWMTWGLLAGFAWGARELLSWHRTLPRELEEEGCATSPLGMFDVAGWTEWGRTLVALRESQGKKAPFLQRGRDFELDRFAESLPDRRGLTSLELWGLGNSQSANRFLMIFSLIFLVIFVPILVVGMALEHGLADYVSFTLPEQGIQILWPIVGQLIFMFLAFPFIFAWQRRPMFSIELLRPINRADWMHMWFRGIANEIVPCLVILVGLISLLWGFGPLQSLTILELALIELSAVGTLAVLVAIGMWILSTTSMWSLLIGGTLIWTAAAVAMAAPMVLFGVKSLPGLVVSPTYLVIATLLLLPMGAISLLTVWWRWKVCEVGRIT